MSSGMEGLVESSNNIGVLSYKNGLVNIACAVRSSVKSKKEAINDEIRAICEWAGAENELTADYPEWPFKVESPIRELMKSVYYKIYEEELKVEAIHAGLECGYLKEKIGDIDMISLGPNLYDVHTPKESLSISSTARVYAFILEVLKRLK